TRTSTIRQRSRVPRAQTRKRTRTIRQRSRVPRTRERTQTRKARSKESRQSMKNFKIDPEFSALFPINRETVEAIKADGEIREPLIVWNGLLIDGHTRYQAAREAKLKFAIQEVTLPDREAVIRWMYARQIATRRNLSPDQIMIVQLRAGLPTKGGMADRKARE